jgi:two-component system, response regulator
MMKNRILFLEHDEDDVYITESFFAELKLDVDVQIVNTAEEVFDSLSQNLSDMEALPDLILVDYNAIPDGALDFISQLKSNPLLNFIPLVVLRGDDNEKIVRECYARGANSFIKKPANIEEISKAIKLLNDYWFDCVSLPR